MLAPHNIVLMQHTRVANSLKYVALIIHFDTTWAIKGFCEKLQDMDKIWAIKGTYESMAFYYTMLIQDTRVVNTLMYIEPVIHFDTMCTILIFKWQEVDKIWAMEDYWKTVAPHNFVLIQFTWTVNSSRYVALIIFISILCGLP